MTETPQIERILKLLLNLSSGIKYSAQDITERFSISKRTFYRDRETLVNAGFAIEMKNGRYWINKSKSTFKELSNLPYFTEEEAWIMRQAILSIDENNILKSNLVEKLYSLYNYGKVAEIIVRKEASENIRKLEEAIREKQEVVLKGYRSAHGNSISDRVVEPFDFTANFISVWAFDTGDMSCKTFKTSRIRSVDRNGRRQQFSKLHKKLPLDVFRIGKENQTPVKLRLNILACNLLREEYPMAEKHLHNDGEQHWIFEVPVSGIDGVGRFIQKKAQHCQKKIFTVT